MMAETLQDIYAELPSINCARKCQECCGPILIPSIEARRLEKRTGYLRTDSVDPFPLGKKWKWMDKAKLTALSPDENLNCQFLIPQTAKCLVYADRPLICRIFGMVKDMRCPHGCTPSRWLSDLEVKGFMQRIFAVREL